jgi:hypothetical protein
MQGEDQYVECTPDLVSKVRTMREAAEKQMNRFTRVSDYDVRRAVGHGPKPTTVSSWDDWPSGQDYGADD